MRVKLRTTCASYVVTVVTVVTLVSACTFDDTVPPNARVRCVEDTQCNDGEACDVETQLCVPAGSEPPAVIAVELPAAASAGVVQLRIDSNVELEAEPVLAWTPVDPGFTFDRVEGASAFFTLVVDDVAAPPDGFYTLASARVTSSAGIERTVPLASSLRIDRVPPGGSALVLHAQFDVDGEGGGGVEDISGPFTERQGRGELLAIVLVDEPVRADEIEGRIDGVSLVVQTCQLDPSGTIFCAFVIAPDNLGALVEEADVEIVVRDLAGNISTISTPAPFDFRPPSIVPGSIAVTLRATTGGGGGTRWSVGEALELSFVVDEDTPIAPVVTTDGPVPLDFELVSAVGRVFRYQRVLDVDPLTDVIVPRIAMADAFGHVSDAVIELPAPFTGGVVIADVEPSPCVFAPGGTAACVDLDDDGALGFQPGVCEPASPDCDDEDPLRGPGFREVRADGVPNDCEDLAEPPNDEENAVYLDPVGGDDLDDGTFFAPVATLGRGLSLARAQGKALYIANGGALSISSETFDVDMVGGLDRDAGWTRTEEVRTSIDVNAAVTLTGTQSYAHLTLADSDGTTIVTAPSTLLDINIVGRFIVRAPSALVDVRAPGIELEAGAPGTRVHGGSFDTALISVEDIRIARATLGSVRLLPSTSAVITNSVLRGTFSGSAVVTCEDCDVSLFHVVMRSDSVFGVRVTGNNAVARVVGAVIDLTLPNAALLDQPQANGTFAFADVVFDADRLRCGAFACEDNTASARLAFAGDGGNDTEETFPGAVLIAADPVIDPNDEHRVLDTSDALGLVGAFPYPGTPSTTAADFEGECRTSPIDAGADSR